MVLRRYPVVLRQWESLCDGYRRCWVCGGSVATSEHLATERHSRRASAPAAFLDGMAPDCVRARVGHLGPTPEPQSPPPAVPSCDVGPAAARPPPLGPKMSLRQAWAEPSAPDARRIRLPGALGCVPWRSEWGGAPVPHIVVDSTLLWHWCRDDSFCDLAVVFDGRVVARMLGQSGGTFMGMKEQVASRLAGRRFSTCAVVPAFRSLPPHKQCGYAASERAQLAHMGDLPAMPALMDLTALARDMKWGEDLYSNNGGIHIRRNVLDVVYACLLDGAADLNLCVGWNSWAPDMEYASQRAFLASLGLCGSACAASASSPPPPPPPPASEPCPPPPPPSPPASGPCPPPPPRLPPSGFGPPPQSLLGNEPRQQPPQQHPLSRLCSPGQSPLVASEGCPLPHPLPVPSGPGLSLRPPSVSEDRSPPQPRPSACGFVVGADSVDEVAAALRCLSCVRVICVVLSLGCLCRLCVARRLFCHARSGEAVDVAGAPGSTRTFLCLLCVSVHVQV